MKKRFRVILVAISCSEYINVEKFRNYAAETASLFTSLYKWYYMPAAVHKVLYHGADIVDFFNLPIGYFSEEPQEARNKDFRRFRRDNCRKSSRLKSNEDLIHWLLISSDPLISSMRESHPKTRKDFDFEVLELLDVE